MTLQIKSALRLFLIIIVYHVFYLKATLQLLYIVYLFSLFMPYNSLILYRLFASLGHVQTMRFRMRNFTFD